MKTPLQMSLTMLVRGHRSRCHHHRHQAEYDRSAAWVHSAAETPAYARRNAIAPASDRARGANSVSIVSAADDPVPVFLPDDLADVMGPDDNSPHGRTTRVGSVLSPRSGEVVFRSGIAADLLAHVPSAPRPRPSRVMVSVGSMGDGSGGDRNGDGDGAMVAPRRSIPTSKRVPLQPSMYASWISSDQEKDRALAVEKPRGESDQ